MSKAPLPENMHQSLSSFYRLPEELIHFRLSGDLKPEAGFFRFGSDAVCYGQCAQGEVSRDARDGLCDVSRNVAAENGGVILPFNPSQVVENLHCERYVNHKQHTPQAWQARQLVRNAYYFVRPLLPIGVRRHFQKLYLSSRDRLRFPEWPVDCTVERHHEQLLTLLLQAGGVDRIPFIWFWPNGASGCLIMTHDVETARGRDFCGRLMDINDSFGIKASFQIVPEQRYPVPPGLIKEIWARGFEVGVQDLNHDGHLYSNREEFLRRVQRINRYAKEYDASGFRAAVLYRNQDWFDSFELEFDMSVPNVARMDPQDGGCCTVMPYFVGRMLEIPVTTTQDYSLFYILEDYTLALWKRQMGLILERHGVVSFIIHPDYIIEPKEQDIYTALLGHIRQVCAERNVWMPLPKEVNQWWRQRNEMQLHQAANGQWEIRGAGKERAQIAFATLQNGKIVYEMAPKPSSPMV